MGGEGDHGLDPAASVDSAPWRKKPDAEIVAEALRHRAEQLRMQLLRPDMTAGEAQLALQRKGRVVYRASVAGGRKDRWYVSGLGQDVTDEDLIAEAEKLEAVKAAA